MEEATVHRRIVEWQDPHAATVKGLSMSGLEYVQSLANKEISMPPIGELMGFDRDGMSIEEGKAVFSAVPAEYHYNMIGIVHASLAMTMLDSAMTCAVHSTLPAGMGYAAIEIKVNFVKAIVLETGRLFCEGTVVHRGSRTATAEGKLTGEKDGKLYAHGTLTCMLMKLG